MKPKLFKSTALDFASNGLGVLTDAITCSVTEERNGVFEVEMTYPVDGVHFEDIELRSIIVAAPNPTANPQPFRVYEITRPMGGVVTIYGEHISYDLSGIPVFPFTAESVTDALAKMKSYSVVGHQFTTWTDKSTTATMSVSTPASFRSLMGGTDGSILDAYGGEWEFDGLTCKLHSARGEDRGVTIRYGKNLTDITQEESCDAMYTGVCPYWYGQVDEVDTLVTVQKKVVNANGTFDFWRYYMLDLTEQFDEAPTQSQLKAAAESYIEANSIGVPKVSLTISFVQLEQTEEYKELAVLERVSLCDTVTVNFEKLGVNASAKVIKTVYNVLQDRYTSVELGDSKSSFVDNVVEPDELTKTKTETTTALQKAIANATKQITGNLGGYVIFHSSTGGKDPDEILIMDTPDINTATKVWRWNKSGLGYSSNGYAGPFGLAMTQDGAIVADYITTGVLNAALLTTGRITDEKGYNYWDLNSGELSLSSTTSIGGQTVAQIALSAAENQNEMFDIALGQQEIFNKLTNNGTVQGLFLKDGQLYMNATYIQSGTINAGLINVTELLAQNITATGVINFSNKKYALAVDESDNITLEAYNDILVRGHKVLDLQSTIGYIRMSCPGSVQISADSGLVVDQEQVVVNGKKLKFNSSGIVTWEAV